MSFRFWESNDNCINFYGKVGWQVIKGLTCPRYMDNNVCARITDRQVNKWVVIFVSPGNSYSTLYVDLNLLLDRCMA